ncbi:MAG: GAF domain-containing protein [Oscillochloridaceae bacterium umkhey_bin13]
MVQFPTPIADAAVLYQAQIANLACARDLDQLAQGVAELLATQLPTHQYRLIWADQLAVAAWPGAAALGRLRAGEVELIEGGAAALVPMRAADQLVGWVEVRPGHWSAEQNVALGLLVAILGPIYQVLRQAPVTQFEQRKAQLRPELERLQGVEAVTALLPQIGSLMRAALPFSNVVIVLRYRASEWDELVYLHVGGRDNFPRLFWRSVSGLSSLVMRNDAPLYTDAYMAECTRRGVAALHDLSPVAVHAWMGAPLRDHEAPFGALAIFSNHPEQVLHDEDRVLFLWLATEVARLVRAAQRYERAAEEARRRSELNQITRAINSSLDPERVPSLIVERAPTLLDAEEASLLLRDEQTGELVFSYAAGPAGQRLLGQRLPSGTGIVGYVAESGQAAIVNDTSADGRFYQNLDGSTGFTTRAVLAVPLHGLDGIKGVLEVLNRRDNAPFTDDDRVLLEALADQAIIALENARRFASIDQALTRRAQELDRSNDRLRKILHAANAVRVDRQLDDLLPQIAQTVAESSGFAGATIALVRRQRIATPIIRLAAVSGQTRPLRDPAPSFALTAFEATLRPEFRRSTLTYLIEGGFHDLNWLRPANVPVARPELRPNGWQMGDLLVCLLRNSRSEVIGVLGLDGPEDGLRPSASQVQILEILANQAAAAIESAQLYAEQQQSLTRMLALNGLGRAINTTLRSPQQIYELTARGMQEMSDARWASVFLGEIATGVLAPSFTTGTAAAVDQAVVALAREAATLRRPLRRTLGEADGTETVVGIPLRGSVDTLGAICIGYGTTLPGPAEIETLQLFASQAATAVESMRLLGEVREGHDRMASIMASTREGLLLVNSAGQIAVANSAFSQLAGCTHWGAGYASLAKLELGQLLERWHQVAHFPPSELELLLSGTAAVAEGLEVYVRGELNGLSPGAPALEWSALRVTQANSPSDPLGLPTPAQRWPILLTIRDITALKETERLRSDLTNMMVHDLRSPLASIITSIDMILRGITGALNATQHEILGIAQASGQNLLNMVNLLLDISRLEGGYMPLERMPLHVDLLVQQALARLQLLAQGKGVQLQVRLAPDLPKVFADEELILRVLQNLLDNALKFSPRESMITLEVKQVPVVEAPIAPAADEFPLRFNQDWMVQITVCDCGIGIEPDDLEQIFTKFGQAGNRRRAGSGLGLTFCKLVVEAHGGQIGVQSRPGEGSRFFFSLPIIETVAD